MEYGLGLLSANTVALEAGTRHYASKALAERIAGGLGVVGGALMSRRCCCSASAARVACGGIAGRQGFEIALSSGDTMHTCWGEFRGNQEEQGENGEMVDWETRSYPADCGLFICTYGPFPLSKSLIPPTRGIAASGHPAGMPGPTGVERLRPRENGQRLGGGEWGETD